MAKVTKGFRTVMEQASDISSIYGSEMLEPRSGNGGLYYELYGMADSGLTQSVNRDNIYMDGIYMKSFQFSHYSKGIKTLSDNALFALCSPEMQDRGETRPALYVMKVLDTVREELCALDAATGADMLTRFFEKGFQLPSANRVAFGVVYATDKAIGVLAGGGAGVYRLRKGILVPVGGTQENAACFPGQRSAYKMDVFRRRRSETFVLCSPNLFRRLPPETLAEAVIRESPEEAVKKMMDKGLSLCNGQSTSMLVLRITDAEASAAGKRRVRRRLALAAGLCAAVLAAGAAGYAAYYRTALAPIEEESRIGDSLAEHQAEVAAARSADEMLAALEGEGGLLPVLRQNTAAYVDLADKCKAEGMTAETYAEYAALTEICYSLNAGIEEMEAALAQAKAAADPLEKESALAVIQSRIIEGGDLYRLSETAVTAAAAAQTALDTLQAQKAVEEAQKQQNQTGTSGGSRISSGSGSGGSSSSSGGSRSSSNRGSGSSNGSTDSTGGSDSSTSSTGSGSSSGSGGDSSSGGSSGPINAGGAD